MCAALVVVAVAVAAVVDATSLCS